MALKISPYHGGKNISGRSGLGKLLLRLLPQADTYVEPFCGMANIFLNRRPVSKLNILNDIDGHVVNLLKAIRDHGDELARRVSLTPVARDEFGSCVPQDATDPIERARQTFIVLANGLMCTTRNKSFKKVYTVWPPLSRNSGRAEDLLEVAKFFVENRVIIENRPAVELIRDVAAKANSRKTLLYLDPPYLPETRGQGKPNSYRNEMETDDHAELLSVIKSLDMNICISGYASELYDAELKGWHRVEMAVSKFCTPQKSRPANPMGLEVVWRNYDRPDGALL